MLLAGDEIGCTHRGNNNTYCQDNELNWLDWDLTKEKEELLDFTRRLIRLRRQHMVFRRRKFFHGRRIRGTDVRDITWLNTDGKEMNDEDWDNSFAKCLGVLLAGDAIREIDEYGERIEGDTILLLMNASSEDIFFILPEYCSGYTWELLLDTFNNKQDV